METEIHVPVGSPTIRKFPIHVDEHNVKDGAMKLIKELRPTWDINRVKTKVGWAFSYKKNKKKRVLSCALASSLNILSLQNKLANLTYTTSI